MTQFNFGPIARTEAGGTENTINLASFPLHVMLNALVGSTSVEEFIAWLWHDLYKPAFYWVDKGKLQWHHVPGMGAFAQGEKKFAQRTNIRTDLVHTHHLKKPLFALRERDFISDQGDQVNLGAAVNYIQLSLAVEPALPTLLARSVIADAFIEVVTKDVAGALQEKFIDVGRTPIEQVRFEFETTSNITFSSRLTDTDIWNKVGQHFDVRMDSKTFIMHHLTPIADPKHESFATVFTADLTGKPLLPKEMLDNTVSLAELLVLYQDSRTVIIAVPQSQLYPMDVPKIRKKTLDTSRRRLEQDFNVLTKKNGVDYLKASFDSQVEIREVPGLLTKHPGKKENFRPLNDAVQRPAKRLTEARNSPDGRVCRLAGTPFVSSLTPAQTRLDKLFSCNFVDTEFVGFGEDIAPLTRLYVINTPKQQSLRGAFAYISPASHFAADEQKLKAVEQPLLDLGGRFRNQLNRMTVTTQEFTLFQKMSRRIIAKLWQRIAPAKYLPLPYLGAIALTHESKNCVRNLLPHLDIIFSDIALKTYPFKSKVRPAIEIALEIAIDKKDKHYNKHTLLKTMSHTITVDPQSAVPILIDDNVQVSLNKAFFERANLLAELTNELKRKKRYNQKDLWLKLILASSDPVTAVFESSQATIDTKKLQALSLEDTAFNDTESFWDRHINKGDFAESWKEYERLNRNTTNALEEFPALLLLLRALQKQTEIRKNKTSSVQQQAEIRKNKASSPQKQTEIRKNEANSPQQLRLFPLQKKDEN